MDDVEEVKGAKLEAEKRQFMIYSLADGVGGQRKVELACLNRGMVGINWKEVPSGGKQKSYIRIRISEVNSSRDGMIVMIV